MSRASALRARLARARLGRAADLDKDPAAIPDPAHDRRAGGAARRDRGAHGQLPRPPLGGAARARGRPAAARLVLAARRSSRSPA